MPLGKWECKFSRRPRSGANSFARRERPPGRSPVRIEGPPIRSGTAKPLRILGKTLTNCHPHSPTLSIRARIRRPDWHDPCIYFSRQRTIVGGDDKTGPRALARILNISPPTIRERPRVDHATTPFLMTRSHGRPLLRSSRLVSFIPRPARPIPRENGNGSITGPHCHCRPFGKSLAGPVGRQGQIKPLELVLRVTEPARSCDRIRSGALRE